MATLIDLSGKVFGRLTVVKYSHSLKRKAFWECICSCGNSITVRGYNLTTGKTRSCSCLRQELKPLIRKNIVVGQKFNLLTVLSFSHSNRGAWWNCQCDCGTINKVRGGALRFGSTKSCGCLQKEIVGKMSYVHGNGKTNQKTAEYTAYYAMIQRCYNPNYSDYKDYGGRGIIICEKWLAPKTGFLCFLNDMGKKPTPSHSLDRYPDMNGNYELSNCRWATPRQQATNTRSNVWVEHLGKRMIITDWAIFLNTKYGNIWAKMKRGETFEQIYNYYTKKHGLT